MAPTPYFSTKEDHVCLFAVLQQPKCRDADSQVVKRNSIQDLLTTTVHSSGQPAKNNSFAPLAKARSMILLFSKGVKRSSLRPERGKHSGVPFPSQPCSRPGRRMTRRNSTNFMTDHRMLWRLAFCRISTIFGICCSGLQMPKSTHQVQLEW